MISADDYQIYWNNELVGLLSDSRPDMWYLEGKWISNKTVSSKSFELAVKESSSKDVFNNLSRGVEISLQDFEGNMTLAIVIILRYTDIFLRRIAVSLKYNNGLCQRLQIER